MSQAIPALGSAVNGLTSAVVGVLLATAYRLAKANIKERAALGIAVAAWVAGAFLGLNAALIVVAAGLIGILLFSTEPTTEKRVQERGA